MLIKTFTALFLTVFTSNAFATDQAVQDEYHHHPAAKPMGIASPFAEFPLEIIPVITQHLDLKSSLACLRVCKAFNSKQDHVLVDQIPHMYQHRGLSTDVFFPFDHPQWTPEKLPIEIALNLHKNFFKALKTKTTEPLDAFKVFYAAGFFGHQLAALEAGKMLLEPALNNTLPALIYFKDLDPALDIKTWGVHRLNQSPITNPVVQEIRSRFINLFDGEDEVDRFAETNQFLQEAREKIDQITNETDEVKVFKIFLQEMHEHHQKYKKIDGFNPEETRKFVKNLASPSPAFQGMITEEAPRKKLTLQDVEFKGILNQDSLQNHLAAFESKIYTKEPPYMRFTVKARQFVQKIIPMQRVLLLLSDDDPTICQLKNFFDHTTDLPAREEEEKKFKTTDQPLDTFLHHLTVTRFLDCIYIDQSDFEVLFFNMEWNFKETNPGRFTLFKEAFSKAIQGKIATQSKQ